MRYVTIVFRVVEGRSSPIAKRSSGLTACCLAASLAPSGTLTGKWDRTPETTLTLAACLSFMAWGQLGNTASAPRRVLRHYVPTGRNIGHDATWRKGVLSFYRCPLIGQGI